MRGTELHQNVKFSGINWKIFYSYLQADALRITNVNSKNPFGSTLAKLWYHINCFFELKETKTSKPIKSTNEIGGWDDLTDEDKNILLAKFGSDFKVSSVIAGLSSDETAAPTIVKDCLFSEFQRIVANIANEPSYTKKSKIIQGHLLQVLMNEFANLIEG